MTRFYSVPFRFLAEANKITAQSSLPLSNVKTINEIFMVFPASSSNKIYYRFFQAPDGGVSENNWPGGRNLFEDYAQAGEFYGDNIAYSIPVQMAPASNPVYLKMAAESELSSDLRAGAIIIIEGD